MNRSKYTIAYALSVRDGKPIHPDDFVFDKTTGQIFEIREEARVSRYLWQQNDDNHYYKIIEIDV